MRFLPLAALLAIACGDSSATPGPDAHRADASACPLVEEAVANEGWTHVEVGSPIDYAHEPPASGPHFPVWARYRIHTEPVERGFWVHNLEHGAIVLLHQPEAPAALVSRLTAAWNALPDDPACLHKRALVVPDPELTTPIAVVAADFVMAGDCVDQAAVLAFAAAHRNMAPEDVCADGNR
jgi:hypothetical protein